MISGHKKLITYSMLVIIILLATFGSISFFLEDSDESNNTQESEKSPSSTTDTEKEFYNQNTTFIENRSKDLEELVGKVKSFDDYITYQGDPQFGKLGLQLAENAVGLKDYENAKKYVDFLVVSNGIDQMQVGRFCYQKVAQNDVERENCRQQLESVYRSTGAISQDGNLNVELLEVSYE